MFFRKSKTADEYGKTAEIMPVIENGNYKAFLVIVNESGRELSSAFSKGGKDMLSNFIKVIDNRISNKDFEDLFDVGDEIHLEHTGKSRVRNLNVERVVTCKGEQGYIFRWSPEE